MKIRPFFVCLVSGLLLVAMATGLTGCASGKKSKTAKSKTPNMEDQSGDVAFRSFQGLLRKAVAKRDVAMLATMMTEDFGYSWEPGGQGAGVFEYWNRNNLWPELELVLREKFVPSGNYMVAPPEVTFDPDYKGYRVGLRLVNGSWRFAYFVSTPPASEIPAQ